MEEVINFFKAFFQINKTLVTVIIMAIPLILLFIGLNLVIFVFDEQAGSIVSNEVQCAKIGKQMLKDGGSVVDAAIATMLCEGVLLPNRAGIGGGFTAILYVAGQVETVTATPMVPKYFSNGSKFDTSNGAQSGGVPGELLGYWELHKKYGLLAWRDLFEPTIKLCEQGIPITEWLELDMQRSPTYRYRSATMRQLYDMIIENREGYVFYFKALAKTLRSIAKHGPKVFYHGDIGKAFVEDMQKAGGVMTMDDLEDYQISWGEPVLFSLPGKKRAFTTGLPTMGPAVALAMNIMKSSEEKDNTVFWHRTIEAMKHAFGMSYSLADITNETDSDVTNAVLETFNNMISMDYAFGMRSKIKDDSISSDYSDYGVKYSSTLQAGTSNICIISPTGQAIVMSSSLMWDFGTFFWSSKTGILLNTQLRSFNAKDSQQNLPVSPAQTVRAGKRALVPHAPTIVLDRLKSEVYFVVGAAGSALIPSQVITALLRFCVMHENASLAANSAFFHPDPLSSNVQFSSSVHQIAFDTKIFEDLQQIGHNITANIKDNPYAIRTCIAHAHVKPDIQFTYHQQGGSEVVEPGHGFNTFLVIVVISLSLWILSWLVYEIASFVNQNSEVNTESEDKI